MRLIRLKNMNGAAGLQTRGGTERAAGLETGGSITQVSERERYGRTTAWRFLPVEARMITIDRVASSRSSCSIPVIAATVSKGTPPVPRTAAVIGAAFANVSVAIFIT